MRNRQKKAIFGLIFGIILVLIYLISPLFKLAYVSYIFDCRPESIQEFKDQGYSLAGQFNATKETQKITIPLSYNQISKSTLKHELCHSVQFERGTLYSCNSPILVYTNELQCYIAQEMPDKLFESIYGRDLAKEMMNLT